jgi:trypsin
MTFISLRRVLIVGILATSSLALLSSSSTAGTPRIINGSQVTDAAKSSRWESYVGIAYKDGSIEEGQFCAGALVSPRHVVTAAHCLYGEDGGNIGVLVGNQDLRLHTSFYNIRRWRIHPSFPAADKPDVAVIELVGTRALKPMHIVGQHEDALWGNGAGGANGWVAGWGAVDPDGFDFPFIMREAQIPIVPDMFCTNPAAGGYSEGAVDITQMLCAGKRDTDASAATNAVATCDGDSGGPLIVQPGANQSPRIVGIVSWGGGMECGSNKYDVYTRMAAVREWVHGIVNTPQGQDLTPAGLTVPTPAPTVSAYTDHDLSITWPVPQIENAATPTEYRVERLTAPDTWSLVTRTNDPRAALTGLPAASEVSLRVIASWGVLESPAGIVTRTLKAEQAPPAPARPSATARTRTTITLGWAGTGGVAALADLKDILVQEKVSGVWKTRITLPSNSVSWKHSKLKPGSSHTYRIVRKDTAGLQSTPSATRTVTTKP